MTSAALGPGGLKRTRGRALWRRSSLPWLGPTSRQSTDFLGRSAHPPSPSAVSQNSRDLVLTRGSVQRVRNPGRIGSHGDMTHYATQPPCDVYKNEY